MEHRGLSRVFNALLFCITFTLSGCGDNDFTQHADEATMRMITKPDALTYLVQVGATYRDIDAVRGDPDPDAGMCKYTAQGIVGASGEHEPFHKWVYTAKIAGVERNGYFDGNLVARVYLQAGIPSSLSVLGGKLKIGSRSDVLNNTCFAYVQRTPNPREVEEQVTNIISALRVLGARRI